jgi:hypothetical protein
MKRHIAWILALLFYSCLPGMRPVFATDYWNINANDLVVKNSPWVDVRAFGTALTEVPIQAAINSLDNTIGGTVYIPPGTYVITNNIYIYGKSNVHLRGAGMGRTIIDGSNAIEQSNPPPGSEPTGVISVYRFSTWSNTLDTTGNPKNITLSDFSIKGDNNAGREQHLLAFGAVNGITIERVEVHNANNREVCEFYQNVKNIKVLNSIFRDSRSGSVFNSMINTNTIYARDILIEGNTFDNVDNGMFVLGDGIRIKNNNFINVLYGVNLEESNTTLSSTLQGAVVEGNTFRGLGCNDPGVGSVGISVKNEGKIMDDNTYEAGAIVSNNSFIDSCNDTSYTYGMYVWGNAIIANNYAVGMKSKLNTNNFFIAVYPGLNQANPARIFLTGNVLQKKPSGYNWDKGVFISNTDNVYVYMNGNFIEADTATVTRYHSTYDPYLSFNGDVLNGPINIGWGVTLNSDNTLNNVPLYGNTVGGISTAFSKGLVQLTFDDTTTPSVKNGSVFNTKPSTTVSITGFDDSQIGQEITVYCSDNTATIVNNANIMRLAGGTNFVCTPYSVIKLLRQDVITTPQWTEVSRSVN